MPLNAPILVQAPTIAPSRYGLLSVAERPQEGTDPHWPNGVEYEYNPAPFSALDVTECTATSEPKDVPDGFPTDEGYPIRYWSGAKCRSVGQTQETVTNRATTQLLAAEGPTLERTVWSGDLGRTFMDEDTVVLGEGGLVAGIGALEDWLYRNYAGTGVIHVPRALAPQLGKDSLVSTSGNRAITKVLETPVSLGAYPNIGPDDSGAERAYVAAPEGKRWLVATGALRLWITQIRTVTNEGAAWFTAETNTIQAIAERTAVITWDYVSAAVLVDADPITPIA